MPCAPIRTHSNLPWNPIDPSLSLLKVPCVVGTDPIWSFVLRQSMAVFAISVALIVLLLKKYVPKFGSPKTNIKIELVNAIGLETQSGLEH